MHWAFDYIGTPWTRDGNDCWQFFRRVQAGDLDSRVSGKLDPHDLER